MSFHEVGAMSAFGMPGVWTWGFGEGWGHHYLDSVAVNHNSNPMHRDLNRSDYRFLWNALLNWNALPLAKR
jgi:hypothetical protein